MGFAEPTASPLLETRAPGKRFVNTILFLVCVYINICVCIPIGYTPTFATTDRKIVCSVLIFVLNDAYCEPVSRLAWRRHAS